MAKIHNYHIDSMQETFNSSVNVTAYPVEDGLPLNDSVQRNPDTFSISGKILDKGKVKNSNDKRKHLKNLMNDGKAIKYVGRLNAKDVLITSFSGTYTSSVGNGFEFTMELQKVRITKTPYIKKKTKKKTSGKKTVKSNKGKAGTGKALKKYHTVKPGENYSIIAKKYGTTIAALRKLNKWPDRSIPAGGRMRVK